MDFQLFIFLAATTTALTVLTLITKRYGLGLLALPFCLAMLFAPFIAVQEETFAIDGATLNGSTDEYGNTFTVVKAVSDSYPYRATITLLQHPNSSVVFANEKRYFDFATASAISSIYILHIVIILLQFWINVKEGTESMLRTGRWE